MKTKLGRLLYKISIIMINCIMIICLIIPTDFVYATNVVSNNNASEKKQLEVKAETFNNKYNLTEEDLFFKYPNYLNNQAEKILFKNINTDLSNAINGLSKTDDFLGAYLTGLANGTSIILQELSHSLGIGDSYYQTHRKQVIKNLIQSYLNSSNYSNEIGSFLPDYFKDIRNIYSNTEYLTSSELKSELIEINSNFSINEQLTNEQINKLVDIVYENDNLLTAANIYEKGITNAQVIASLFQVYTAEKEFICQISQYIDSKEIQQDLSDYYDEISADFPTRVLNLLKSKVSLESVASFTLKLCEIASNTSLEWPTYAFTKLFVSLAIKYLPLPATGDEIIDATISYSICTSLKTSIDQLKSNFRINKGTKQEMEDFGILYNFYLSSLKNCLNTTKELTTNQYKEVFNNWIKLLENSYSYNTFVKNCLMSITNDIDAGIIERPENIDNYVPKEDENYKENILKRFQAIQAKYPPNQNVQWLGNHGGATQCFGFARMVFSLLFGCEMPTNYKGTEKEAYAYRQSTNINIVGQLVESQVTETNLKNLFSKGALGDIVQMYGGPAGYRSPHTMILVGLSSSGNGIIVYDCNSARNGQAVNSCYINQYEISFTELAKNYSISDSISKAGITLYRAANYTEIYGEGILFYDDSINFVIEDGVLIKYNGWQSHVIVPDEVEEIGEGAFENNNNIVSVTLPLGIKKIYDDAFRNCTRLSYINFPEGLTSIGDYAFQNCTSLLSFVAPSSLKEVGFSAFADCSLLGYVNIINTKIEMLSSYLFQNCESLTSIDIPNTVIEIGSNAFENTNLSELSIPESVTDLGKEIISGNKLIKEIVFPKNIENAGDSRFSPFTGSTVEKVIFENGITAIPAWSCQNTENLKEIIIPDTVTEIGVSAFADNPLLEHIDLSSSIIKIEDSAFSDTALTSIEIPDSVTRIGSNAFENCKKLTSVALSDKINTIESGTFANCSSLSNVKIPNSVISMESHVFENCDSLKNIEIPNSVEKIKSYAFHDCDSLENVSLGTGITTIPSYCFSHCDSLKDMHLPYRVTTIEENAFSLCTSLSSIYIPRTVTNIENNVFSYPSKITIYGIKDSYAETYANDNAIRFVEKCINAEEIILDKTEINLLKGQKDKLNLTIKPLDFTDQVTWKSSNSDIVEVDDNGNIVAKNTGKATIKVSVGDKSVSCTVIVNEPIDDIYLNETYLSLDALEKFQLEARIYPEDAFNQSLEWSSSNEKVASIDQTGLITTHSKGKAVITVKALDGSNITASCTVNVKNNGYVVNNIDDFESPHNYENDCNDFWIYHSDTAESLQILFDEKTYFEDNFDYLYIYDGHNNLIGKYTGNELSDKSILVEDNTIKIQLITDNQGTEWGFKVNQINDMSYNDKKEQFISGITLFEKNLGDPSFALDVHTDGDGTLSYLSENENIVKVSSTGIVSIIGAGETNIIVTASETDSFKEASLMIHIKVSEKKLNGWIQNDGLWFYYKDNQKVIGWFNDNGKWYYLGTNGAMLTGWQLINDKWYYLNNYMYTGWFNDNGKWYYLGTNGTMLTGWQLINNKWYYLNNYMYTGWLNDSGKWYYLGINGAMLTGWQLINDKWYYLNNYMYTGWFNDNGKWYYLGTNGAMLTGWQLINNKWYYLNNFMQIGWCSINNNWYYFGSNGVMLTGWQLIDNKWYYMESNGKMVTGQKYINGKKYFFNESGVWIS